MNSGKVYNTLKYKLNNDILKIIQKYNIVNLKRQYNLVIYNIKYFLSNNILVNSTFSKDRGNRFFYCLFCDKPTFLTLAYIKYCLLNSLFKRHRKDVKYIFRNVYSIIDGEGWCRQCDLVCQKKFKVVREIDKNNKLIF
jgi:hypothetical protein